MDLSKPPDFPYAFPLPISPLAAHLARVHLAVTIPLMALTLLPLISRLYLRLRRPPSHHLPSSTQRLPLGYDDILILLAFAVSIINWAFLQQQMILSPREITLGEFTHAVKFAYLGIFLWSITMLCIKASVALTLLRFPLGGWWRAGVLGILALQAVYFIADTIYIFGVKCHPLHAAWDITIPPSSKVCADGRTDIIISSVGSAINAITNLLLSIAPMIVLAKLRRPRRERVLVCGLTGIGLLASGASIVKAVKVGQWGSREDEWALAMQIATWTVVEMFVAVLAACSPSLKGPIEGVLGRVGIRLTGQRGKGFFGRGREMGGEGRRVEVVEEELEVQGRSGPVVFRDGEELEGKEDSTTAKRMAARKARKEARRREREMASEGEMQLGEEGVIGTAESMVDDKQVG